MTLPAATFKSALERELKPSVESHDYRLHAKLDRIGHARLWCAKWDLFYQTVLPKAG